MLYICCRQCMEDPKRTGESMRSHERLSVSMSDDSTKIQIWCNRHHTEVATFGNGRWLERITDGVHVTQGACRHQTAQS